MQDVMMLALLELVLLLILSVGVSGQAEQTYQAQCSSCHAMDGSASTPAGKKMGAADLRSQEVQSLSDEELFNTIAYGLKHKQYPHAFVRRGLTEKQVADLVIHIRKLSKHK
jgi:mono/diheme cytochrome c family protein